MAVAFDVRPLRTALRAAAVGLAALLAASMLVAPASAAPSRPGAVAAPDSLAETVAARKGPRAGKAAKVKRGKYVKRRVVRAGRYDGAPAVLGAVAAGVLGAAMVGGYRDDYEYDGPIYVQQPYGGGYGYGHQRPRYYGGDGYDRRYWRGGAPRHVEPAPGYQQQRGSRWGERPAVRPEGPRGGFGGGYVGRGGAWGPAVGSPTPMNPNLPAGAPPMVRDTGGNWMPNTYSGEGSGR